MYSLNKIEDAEKIKAIEVIYKPILSLVHIQQMGTDILGYPFVVCTSNTKQIAFDDFFNSISPSKIKIIVELTSENMVFNMGDMLSKELPFVTMKVSLKSIFEQKTIFFL